MSAQPERGRVVGNRYRLEEILGEGGMAVVWRATHTETDRGVALKLVRREFVKDDQVREMFVREARVGARIGSNLHIVDFLDAGVDEALAVPFLAMELLVGEPLDARIKREGPVPRALTADLLEQLADALDQAHGAGVFHRDLKPQNLFLSKDKKGRLTLKVLDFGIAKLAESVQQSSTHVGTPAYSAPEQLGPAWRVIAEQKQKAIATQVSGATDVWALGLVVFEMLTGTSSGTLWGATTLAELPVKIVLEPTPLASSRAGERSSMLPDGFDAWIARCLDLDATKRFPTAGEAAQAIIPALRGVAVAVPAAAVAPEAVSPPPAAAKPKPGGGTMAIVPGAPVQGPAGGAWPAGAAPPQQTIASVPLPYAGVTPPRPGPYPMGGPPSAAAGWTPWPQQGAPPHAAPQGPGPHAWPQPDPRMASWAAHRRATMNIPANTPFYLAHNAQLQFMPKFQHAWRDAVTGVRDAKIYLVEMTPEDPLRKVAGEDKFLVGLLVSHRLRYRAAVRSKLTSNIVDGIGQMFDSLGPPKTLNDPHFERFYDLRFPTPQEGQAALPFSLRQVLINAQFRGILEIRQGNFLIRRFDATRFDPVDFEKLLEAMNGIYAALAP